jgi:hypothetical protein
MRHGITTWQTGNGCTLPEEIRTPRFRGETLGADAERLAQGNIARLPPLEAQTERAVAPSAEPETQ